MYDWLVQITVLKLHPTPFNLQVPGLVSVLFPVSY